MSDSTQQGQDEAIGVVKKGAGWLIFLGILTVVFGIFAISTPFIAGISVTIVVGALLLVNGVFHVVQGFGVPGWKGKTLTILVGVLTVIGGGLILSRPMLGLSVFTLMIAIYFVMEGVMTIIMSFQLKPEKGWGWALFSGIVSLLLGFIIWRQWPVSGVWAIGILVGVRMLMAGWGMIGVGSVARGAAKEAGA
jgi:uncharacterized membrane protein HdeD (DUF308 family)